MPEFINRIQVISTHQEIEQPKMPLGTDEQEKEQTMVTVLKDNVLTSVSSWLSQQEPYVDAHGNRRCFWCHVQLRYMKLYSRQSTLALLQRLQRELPGE